MVYGTRKLAHLMIPTNRFLSTHSALWLLKSSKAPQVTTKNTVRSKKHFLI